MKNHKGRILEPVEKLKGGSRSRSPRPRYDENAVLTILPLYWSRCLPNEPDGLFTILYVFVTYHVMCQKTDGLHRSRSPPRRSRSPSRSRSPEGGGNEKASTSSPYSHGRADSRSPLQRSDFDYFMHIFCIPEGMLSTEQGVYIAESVNSSGI
uniref:Uncharacterized protein n=1 Tax=Lactuca sativa TaxID=4236 RepID=A0A9R1VNB8_LACSA|nr:hypothetical protein LSAT_V11C400188990 [Lactuca sativa]